MVTSLFSLNFDRNHFIFKYMIRLIEPFITFSVANNAVNYIILPLSFYIE